MTSLSFFLGTYTGASEKGGIQHVLIEDMADFRSVRIRLAAEARNPSWISLTRSGRELVATEELSSASAPRIIRYKINGAELHPAGSAVLPGSDTCHVAVSDDGTLAATAQYGDGSVALWRLPDAGGAPKRLDDLQMTGSGPARPRQDRSHAHYVTFIEDRMLFATDLGSDAVYAFSVSTEDTADPLLRQEQILKLFAGSGPRHLAFAGRDLVFAACELDETVHVLRHAAGRLTFLETIPVFSPPPEGEGALSAIRVSADQRYVYIGGRRQNAIAAFRIDACGSLQKVGTYDCGGRHPRDMAISPCDRWMVVANQHSDCISIFARDTETGHLTAVGHPIPVGAPSCIVFTTAG